MESLIEKIITKFDNSYASQAKSPKTQVGEYV